MKLTRLINNGLSFELYVEHEILNDDFSKNSEYSSSDIEDDDSFDVNVERCVEEEEKERHSDLNRDKGLIIAEAFDEEIKSDVEVPSDELGSDSSDSNGTCKVKYPSFKRGGENESLKFELGVLFNSLNDFKDAINDYAVKGGWNIRFVKNDKTRVRAKCVEGCKWVAYCSKVQNERTFQLKTLVDEHTCSKSFKNRRLSSKWLSKHIVDDVKEQPRIKLVSIQDKLKRKYVVQISRGKAFRAKQKALDIVHGSHKEQYSKLWEYCEELRMSNPGTVAQMNLNIRHEPEEIEGAPIERMRIIQTFQRLYICMDGCKQGFLKGCRPIIGLDACHLKGPYGGQLMAAVGRDANDQFFPLAFSVVEAETKESWTWFLQLLLGTIEYGPNRKYTFISDQQKVITILFH